MDLSLPGTKIAIEADGPTHIARTDPSRMLGATAMKRRHLTQLGWHVINVSFQVGAWRWGLVGFEGGKGNDKLPPNAARLAFYQR